MTLYIRDLGGGKHAVKCPWEEAHTTPSSDTSTVIFEGTDTRPPGFKCQHAHCSDRSIRDVLKYFNARGDIPSQPEGQFSFKTLQDLFNEPEELTQWLVDGLLPTAGISMLAAKAKTGKTTLSSELALCVARGEPFLGRKTLKGPVLHLAVEEKSSEVVRRYRAQGAHGDESIHVHAAKVPPRALELLADVVAELKPVLVIIDTLFRVARIENGNDYAEVTREFEPITNLARESGAHVMVLHHMGKSDREDGDGILGSTSLQACVDQMILLNRKERHRTLKTIQRYGDSMEETIIEFDPETRRSRLGVAKQVDHLNALSVSILNFLTTAGSSTTAEIAEGVASKRQSVIRSLEKLAEEKKVTRIGTGKRGIPFKFSLSEHPTPPF